MSNTYKNEAHITKLFHLRDYKVYFRNNNKKMFNVMETECSTNVLVEDGEEISLLKCFLT